MSDCRNRSVITFIGLRSVTRKDQIMQWRLRGEVLTNTIQNSQVTDYYKTRRPIIIRPVAWLCTASARQVFQRKTEKKKCKEARTILGTCSFQWKPLNRCWEAPVLHDSNIGYYKCLYLRLETSFLRAFGASNHPQDMDFALGLSSGASCPPQRTPPFLTY